MPTLMSADVRIDPHNPTLHVIGWRAWTVDETGLWRIKGSSIKEWAEVVPPEGFQVWVLYYNQRLPGLLGLDRKIISGFDYYFMAPGRKGEPIYGFTNNSYDLAHYKGADVKCGRSVDEVTFHEIMEEAQNAVEWEG